MDSASFKYDVEEVNWCRENEICQKAIEDNNALEDFEYTHAYDDFFFSMFDTSSTHHYEFELPKEMVLAIPVDTNESHLIGLPDDITTEIMDHLAWRQMISLLPVTNIHEVPNESTDTTESVEVTDPELLKLEEMEAFVNATMDTMFEQLDKDYSSDCSKFVISVELNGRKFELDCCAKEYNGLLEYIEYMKSEI